MESPASAFASAVELHAAGNLAAAATGFEQQLAIDPSHVGALTHLGVVRMQQGLLPAALPLFDRALAVDSTSADAHAGRGEVLRRQGSLRAAIESLRAALRLRPTLATAWFNLGLALAEVEEADEARDAWKRFLELRPNDARIRQELGRLAYRRSNLREAASWFAQQSERFPDDWSAVCDHASVLMAERQFDAAIRLLQPITLRETHNPRVQLLLAKAMIAAGLASAALDLLLAAAVRMAQDVNIAYLTATTFDQLARLPEAIAWFERAAALAPNRADIRNSLAVAHLNFANHDEAIANFREAVAIEPSFHEAHSNLLIALHYSAGNDTDQLHEEHLRWAAMHSSKTPHSRTAFTRDRSAHKRLKIGYLSPRFCEGPLASFFLPLMQSHDRESFDIACYATSTVNDAMTDAIRRHADRWRDCSGLDDDALEAVVGDDGVDIMVDLTGHCPGNRLVLFSRRAAPIQVTWLDYVDTTGLQTIDYILTDEEHTPEGGTQRFSETVVRLPRGRLCYLPKEPLPPIVAAPSSTRGHVTFGCFNRLSKCGDEVIRTWCEIMRRIADSRLILKSTAFAAIDTRRAVEARFARCGVDASRLELRPYSSVESMMIEYGDIDIALDPFPYNGATTTCDALSMGVPVVTLAGATLAGRQGVSILSSACLHDWIARDTAEYVEIATAAALDRQRLVTLRARLRSDFLSAGCDAPGFARSVEEAYRSMWQRWCDEQR